MWSIVVSLPLFHLTCLNSGCSVQAVTLTRLGPALSIRSTLLVPFREMATQRLQLHSHCIAIAVLETPSEQVPSAFPSALSISPSRRKVWLSHFRNCVSTLYHSCSFSSLFFAVAYHSCSFALSIFAFAYHSCSFVPLIFAIALTGFNPGLSTFSSRLLRKLR